MAGDGEQLELLGHLGLGFGDQECEGEDAFVNGMNYIIL